MTTMSERLRRWAGRSLLRRLGLWTAAIVAASGVLAAALSYALGYDEANALQDAQLRQIAALVHGWGALPAAVLRGGDDTDARIVVQPLDAPVPPGGLRLPTTLHDGMQPLRVAGEDWRVFVSAGRAGRIAVAQRAELRSEAALDSAQRTIVPMLALVPLLVLLSAWVVRRALRPVRRLADEVDARDAASLQRLDLEQVPLELRPFLASINGLLERLGDAVERERRFVADAAHELRTPVAALSVQADNLAHGALPDDARQRLHALRQGLERARGVVEQLLGLARAQSAAQPLAQPVALRALLRQVVEDLMPLADARRIDLGLDTGDDVELRSDPTLLYIFVRNAVDNAIRYTAAGGRVDLALRRDAEGRVEIDVVDDGPGIAPALVERAFEPFERLGHAGAGSGLGLPIMRGVARKLGAELELSAALPHGLTVRLRLPS